MDDFSVSVPWGTKSHAQTPPKRRGSGDIQLIPLASLNVDCFLRRIFQPPSHCRRGSGDIRLIHQKFYSLLYAYLQTDN